MVPLSTTNPSLRKGSQYCRCCRSYSCFSCCCCWCCCCFCRCCRCYWHCYYGVEAKDDGIGGLSNLLTSSNQSDHILISPPTISISDPPPSIMMKSSSWWCWETWESLFREVERWQKTFRSALLIATSPSFYAWWMGVGKRASSVMTISPLWRSGHQSLLIPWSRLQLRWIATLRQLSSLLGCRCCCSCSCCCYSWDTCPNLSSWMLCSKHKKYGKIFTVYVFGKISITYAKYGVTRSHLLHQVLLSHPKSPNP